ncbi:hypothetical protein [uncultured Draconibacterium sp.]|uniref:hypothetical protein n=1 Tax=uncultured Draconibacterium sp. TaxID=1573823 RepID=UPI0025D363C4|nr:hypothetical protein [uncultured Draconibacterium sp.]
MALPFEAYKNKVWAFLNNMKPGDRYLISEICEKENETKFIACIKAWMDQMPWQGGLSFNADYTQFYMTHIPMVFTSLQNSPENEAIHHSA